MKILKTEVTIAITDEILSEETNQEIGYDCMVNWIYEGELYDGYKVLECQNLLNIQSFRVNTKAS